MEEAKIEEEVEREHGANEDKLREWVKKAKAQEASLDFNKKFHSMNGHLQAKYDRTHIYKDALSTLMPPPTVPGFHGMYSTAMAGSTVPGFPDPRVKHVGLVSNSDLKPDHLHRATRGTVGVVPQAAGLSDKGGDKDVMSAMRKLLEKGKQSDKDIDVREFGRDRPWRATV